MRVEKDARLEEESEAALTRLKMERVKEVEPVMLAMEG